ncbi:MAG TPA: choice-of-anchor R domain-containing protein [Thermoplasmata archaeon]|nr:choice-of-anchor R domain-containing protein [Thermoplasmata archaeon]
MRGPPTRVGVVLAVFLLLAAAGAAFLAGPAMAIAPRVFDSNTVIGSGDPFFLVWSGESVAQSFTASSTYILLNLTLRLRNPGGGGNVVNITVRPDAAGVPSGSLLAWATALAAATVGPVNVPLTPTPTLVQGTLYWIVATKGGGSANGYEWHHSNNDTYAGGKAMLNTGTGWTNPGTPTDMWFLTYGRQTDANVSVAMTGSAPRARPKDAVTFTLYMNNTGTIAAPLVWLNDTLPVGFTFVSDTAGSVPAITGFPNYTFASLAYGPHAFSMTAAVDVGVAPGTTLTNRATLTFTNATGVRMPPRIAAASVVIGLQWKQLYLVPGNPGPPQSLVPDPPTGGAGSQVVYQVPRGGAAVDFLLVNPLGRTFRLLNVTSVLYLDSRSHLTRNLDMNFTLLDVVGASQTAVAYEQLRVTTDNIPGYQAFSFPFPNLDLNVSAGHQVLLRIKDMTSSQDDALLAVNATATPSQMDVLTTTYVQVDVLGLRDASGPAVVWSPKDALVVRANVSDPFGAAEIAGAWINLTDPMGSRVLNFVPMTLLASNVSAWKLFGAAYGPALANGTYAIEIMVEEGNGVLAYATATALVRAPSFDLVLVPTQSSALSGDTFFFAVWYNNTGSGPAGRAWINLTLPNQLLFVTSSAESNRTGPTAWTWTNVGVGSHFFLVEVTVRSGIPPAPSILTRAGLNHTDEKGHLWPSLAASAAVILQGPVLALGFSSSTATIHANETFVLTLTLQNTGDPAADVWLNVSWSAGLVYVSDSSSSVGGTSAPVPDGVDIEWSSFGSGASGAVNVTVRGGSGLPRGKNLASSAVLTYTNARQALMPTQAAAVSVRVIAPEVANASIRLARSLVTPGDLLPATLNFTNDGDEAALSLVATLILDPSLRVRDASLPVTVSGSAAIFVLSGVGLGPRRIFLNLSVASGASDGAVLTMSGSIVYTDRFGNPQPVVFLNVVNATVAGPRLLVTVSPSDGVVEGGAPITIRIDPTNQGTGAAGGVWLNATLPNDLLYVSDSSDGQRSGAGGHIAWHWAGFGLGSRAFNLTLAARGSVANGTTETVSLAATYTDANGNLGPVVTTTARATFVVPAIQLSLATSVGAVPAETTFYYTLRVKNVGSTPARTVWLTDSLDANLKVFSYTSSVVPSGTQSLNWTYTEIQPGEEQAITLFVQVPAGVAVGTQIPNLITAVFTNSQGAVVGSAQSTAVVVAVAAPPSVWPYVLVGVAAAAGAVAFLVYRRRSSRIEEVFVMTSAGLLIDHLSRELAPDKDPDLVGGMLTGVQDFVRDAFKLGEDRSLHELEFGDYHVLIVRGKDIFLAAVTSGRDTHGVESKLKVALARIEKEYGDVLAKFNGEVDRILGVREFLRHRLLR